MLVKLESYEDERGRLVVAEEQPFPFRRVFWVDGFKEGLERGGHAHLNGEQLIVAVKGRVAVSLETQLSRGHFTRETWVLDRPDRAVYVKAGQYVTYYGSKDAVCLVLASQPYDEADLIPKGDEN